MKFKISLLLFIFITQLSIAQNSIERMDPPNWWVGMKHNKVQILLYGDKVGTLDPSINYEGVSLERATKVQNSNYLFLSVVIDADAKPGDVAINFSRNGKVVESKNFPIYERRKGRADVEGFNTKDVIYLITPDRFANGDPSNDSMDNLKEKVDRKNKGGRHGGDIEGMRQSLDYIKDLGFTAIWLNPVLENDMEVYSYHGYSTTDYYKVDPRFGTNEAYQQLAEEARSKGMKLIMDMIVNHCGSNHWWMNDLPSNDWINQWEEMTYTNHQKTALQDPYVSDFDKKGFTDGWFVATMPDLNQRNDLMADYLTLNSIWWVEFLGLAGIRMDTYPYPDMDYMTEWTEALMKEYPDLNIVGEEWNESPAIVSYWQKGKVNPNGYTSELRSVMDFPVQATFTRALVEEESWGSGLKPLYEMIAHDFLYPDPMNLVIFPDNHDMMRIYSQLNEDYDLFKQAMVFYATMRGIPQFYYGTEILMPSTGDHGIVRTDFPGGWAGDEVNAFTGKGLTDRQKEAQAFTTQLLQWRKKATAVHNGKMMHFIPRNGVYIYFRYNDDQTLMVILNKNEKEVNLDLRPFAERLDGKKMGKDVLSSKMHPLKRGITVEPKSATILELR